MGVGKIFFGLARFDPQVPWMHFIDQEVLCQIIPVKTDQDLTRPSAIKKLKKKIAIQSFSW